MSKPLIHVPLDEDELQLLIESLQENRQNMPTGSIGKQLVVSLDQLAARLTEELKELTGTAGAAN
jgi:hypothetical protein